MSLTYPQLTPRDPIIARDGRPFGFEQGNRMRSLDWPLPSVVAGSFRTALVKANPQLDFSGDMPSRLLDIAVAGVFPVHDGELHLPAPDDAVAEPAQNRKEIKTLYRAKPRERRDGGCDFPEDLPLQPVMLADRIEDFKPADLPAWWPLSKYVEWLTSSEEKREGQWLTREFLHAPRQEVRDHVCLDADRGAAAEGQLFSTAGLNLTHLPRFVPKSNDGWKLARDFDLP